MKQVIVEINGKKHGPLEVSPLGDLTINSLFFSIDQLRNLGAKIIEHKEPLRWEGEVRVPMRIQIESPVSLKLYMLPNEFEGKRFHAVLTEIVED